MSEMQATPGRPLRVGLIGARGYVGAELIALLSNHPQFELALVASRELAGTAITAQVPAFRGALEYTNPTPEAASEAGLDALILALPNGKADPWVHALDARAAGTVVVDLSADFRFDAEWYYGLPELTRGRYAGQRRISNPGCYATAMQLALAPMLGALQGPVQCFGISGYSGAGTTPSDKNDTVKLRDNLMPYALAGHVHEREVSEQLGWPVEFMPHVAPHFRGLSITANLHLQRRWTRDEVIAHYAGFYSAEPLVEVTPDAPWVTGVAGTHFTRLGGFTLGADGCRLVVVSVLDNLLKGAATQAVQNLNLAFGLDELEGLGMRSAS